MLAAYRAGWAAFEHALADANPEDPELAATMVDPELQQVKANLLVDEQQGMVGRGTTTLHPRVTALSATSATVVDCAYGTAELVYKATGKPVPPITPPENDGVTSTLVLSQPNAGVVQVNPVVVGQQAVKHVFASPTIEMAPPDGSPQLVGVVAVDRPGCLAHPDRVGDCRPCDGDGDGDPVEGGVGHGRR